MPKPERVPYFLSAREVLRRSPMNRDGEKTKKRREERECEKWIYSNVAEITRMFEDKLLFESLDLTDFVPREYREGLKAELENHGYSVKTEKIYKFIRLPNVTKRIFKVRKLRAPAKSNLDAKFFPPRFHARRLYELMMETQQKEAEKLIEKFAKIAEEWDPYTVPRKEMDMTPEQKKVRAYIVFKNALSAEGYKTTFEDGTIFISIHEK